MSLGPKSFPVDLDQKTNYFSFLFKCFQNLIHLAILGIIKNQRRKTKYSSHYSV